ncbi:hypothetical protein CHS0354_027636 [Potamilus streckersoni]|uniref:Uncharacterized protein n=1 Tax=Potamilus streckersoni TaxID=2493646 RepID=A0AAE0T0C7_9BIVA|nr:hypothetical protein CHS0354_027636 [Potamilus streckersoni]
MYLSKLKPKDEAFDSSRRQAIKIRINTDSNSCWTASEKDSTWIPKQDDAQVEMMLKTGVSVVEFNVYFILST